MNNEMQNIVKLWFDKAQNDWATVKILMQNESYPHDIVCYHCQQYVEKLLKGLLTAYEIEFPKTHDLRRLIQLAQILPQLASLADRADELTNYAIQSRYPDPFVSISQEQVREAIAAARSFADVIEPVIFRNDQR